MNILVSGQWASFAGWAALITAIAGVITVVVRIIQVLSKSFTDLMNTLEEDNQKLREALSSAELGRTELADKLVSVHKEIATTITANSAVVSRLQHELDEYRQSNLHLLDEVQSLKRQLTEYMTINQALSDRIAQIQALSPAPLPVTLSTILPVTE